MWSHFAVSGKHCSLDVYTTSVSYHFSSLFQEYPFALARGVFCVCLFRDEHSTVTYSLCIGQLKALLIAINQRKKLLWWRTRDVLIYENNSKSVGVIVIVCPLSRATAWLLCRVYELSSHRFWASLNNTLCKICLMDQAWDPIIEWLVTPISFLPLLYMGHISSGQ